jgi:hypothetical protein
VKTSFLPRGNELRLRLNREREEVLAEEQRGRQERGEAREGENP